MEGRPDDRARVCFSPNGDYLATLGSSALTVWNAHPCQRTLNLRHAGAAVQCLAFRPDEQQIATGGGDGVVKVWDLATGREVFSAGKGGQPVANVAFSLDSREVGIRYPDGSVLAWDVQTGHESGSAGLKFGPDGGRRIESPGGLRAAACAERVYVWDSRLTSEERAFRLALAVPHPAGVGTDNPAGK